MNEGQGVEWQAPRKFFQPSADERYTVSAARLPDRISYAAWRRQSPVAKQLGTADTAQACREICEADAAQRDIETVATTG